MRTWHQALAVFQGGTQQITALKGKRVRTRVPLLSARLRNVDPNIHATKEVPVGSIGFVTNPIHDELLIAFPNNHNQQFTTLEALVRGGAFFVIYVNEPTFKARFEVEV